MLCGAFWQAKQAVTKKAEAKIVALEQEVATTKSKNTVLELELKAAIQRVAELEKRQAKEAKKQQNGDEDDEEEADMEVVLVAATENGSALEYAANECKADKEVVLADPNLSTEELHGVSHFQGIHSDIRPLLDYTYHRKYSEQREAVQDNLIMQMCRNCARLGNEMLPWVIFTAGAMGAGKGYVMRWMDKNGYVPLQNFITVDPDAIRQMLPEWNLYVAADPEKAGDMTQKEAGCVAEILGYRALRDRFNVIFDGSLRDTKWYKSYFQRLRDNFPGIRIMILHVVAEKEEVLAHAHARALETGRAVPVELIENSMKQVPESVKVLSSYCDFVCRVMNRKGRQPEVMREEGSTIPPANIDISWDLIRTLWTDLDLDGDGILSAEEINHGISHGRLTQRVIKTLDANFDGAISESEVLAARKACHRAGSKIWR